MTEDTASQEQEIPPNAIGGTVKRGRAAARQAIHGVTGRGRPEEELRESEERLKVLFESAPDAYYLNDLNGTFVDGNRAAEEITGYKRDELIGGNFLRLNLLPPEEVPKAAAALAKNVAGQPTGPDEFILNRKDGGQVAVEVRTFPVRIKDRALVLGIARDITERKRAEEALRKAHDELEMRVKERTVELRSAYAQLQGELAQRKRAEEAILESEEKYRTLFEQAADAILLAILPDGEIVTANSAAAEMLGYSPEELIGLRARQRVIAPEVREQTQNEWGRQLNEKGCYDLETLWVRKDGSRVPVSVTGRPLAIRGRYLFQIIARNITERKRAEEQLQAARAMLEGKVEQQMLRRNPYGLTFRELTVLHLVAAGRSDKQIAIELSISPLTAQKHVSNILTKMGAGSRTEATARALRKGLLD